MLNCKIVQKKGKKRTFFKRRENCVWVTFLPFLYPQPNIDTTTSPLFMMPVALAMHEANDRTETGLIFNQRCKGMMEEMQRRSPPIVAGI